MTQPLYVAIKDDLLAKIEDGTYGVGDTIPSEVDLAAAYGVSRPTVRQALQVLCDGGYLERRRRRGTIVCPPKVETGFIERLTSFQGDVEGMGRSTQTSVLALRREAAGAEVAEALELEEEAEVFCLVRLRSVDGVPAVLVRSYVPADLYPTLDDHDFSRERLYGVFEALGHPIRSATRRLDVCLPDPVVAALLDIDRTAPCFLFHTVGRQGDGRPVEYSIATYRGDTNSFTVSLEIQED